MPSLPDRGLVEDRCHSVNEPVVKIRQPHNNAFLLSFPDFVSGGSFNLFLPPKRVAFYWKGGDGVEFHLVRVFGG